MSMRKCDISVCSCLSSRDNLSDFPELKEMLPSDYKYNVCNWKKVDAHHFESRFRVNVTTIMEAYVWLKKFSIATNTIFEADRELPECEEAVFFSLRCNHTAIEPPRKYEGIDFLVSKKRICPTRLLLILKLPAYLKKYGHQGDVHLRDFPLTVIHHQHHSHETTMINHEIPSDSPEDAPSANRRIINTLNALEIQLQKLVPILHAVENRNHTEFQPYQVVIDSLFPVKSAEEEKERDFFLPLEKHPFDFDVDTSSLIDYYRSTVCRPARTEEVWIRPRRHYRQPVDMVMLPHIPIQEIINPAFEKLRNLEEVEENSVTG